MNPRIDVLAVVAVGPAIKRTVLYRRHVIRHQIGTDLVALVDHGPQRAALGFEGQAIRIAQPAGEDTGLSGSAIDLKDVGAVFLRLDAVLRNVAVGSNADIKLRSIRTGDKALCPVVVYRTARQRHQRFTRRGDAHVAGLVWVPDDCIRVGDIKIAAYQRDAKG